MALLETKNLGISFGGLRAVNAFDISVEKGQCTSRTREQSCWTA